MSSHTTSVYATGSYTMDLEMEKVFAHIIGRIVQPIQKSATMLHGMRKLLVARISIAFVKL